MNNRILEVEAYIYDEKIGTLLLHEDRVYFNYDLEFIAKEIQISPIKLNIYNTPEIYTNNDSPIYRGMAGVFFDSLPDKFGMSFIDRYFESKGYAVKDITLLDRLSFIGDRGMGAIEYRPKEEESILNVQKNLLVAKELFENMQDVFSKKKESYLVEELMEVLYGASPLGGGRPKLLISFNERTKEIRTNDKVLHQGFERSIIKFDEAYYENESIELTKFEYLYMNMAKACGIEIPKIFLLEELGLHHLIIKRFDRDKNDSKIHISTASALLHKDISIPKVISYEELFSLTNKICKKQSSVEELFKRMVFNTLSFNVDDHAKNFSFMMDKEGNWELTPAYDVTYSYGMVKEHLTTINGKGRDFILADYLDIAKKNLISKERAMEMVRQIVAIMETLKERAEVIGLSSDNISECLGNVNVQLTLIKEELY